MTVRLCDISACLVDESICCCLLPFVVENWKQRVTVVITALSSGSLSRSGKELTDCGRKEVYGTPAAQQLYKSSVITATGRCSCIRNCKKITKK